MKMILPRAMANLRKLFGVIAAAVFALALFAVPARSAQYDKYGGWTGVASKPTGFFRVEEIKGRYFLITPDGNAFFSIGINHLNPYGDNCPALGYSPYQKTVEAKYGSMEKWAEPSLARLKEWGFNTLGAWTWSDMFNKQVPYTVIMDLSGSSWRRGGFADYFDPAWKASVEKTAQDTCKPRAGDPYLLGYFLANEMKWGPDWRGASRVFPSYVSLDSASAGKIALVNFFREKYINIEKFNGAHGSAFSSFDEIAAAKTLTRWPKSDEREFLSLAAEEFFSTAASAVRRADPNHLILGSRIHAMGAPEEVVRAAGKYCDVLSVNYYRHGAMEKPVSRSFGSLPLDNFLEEYFKVSGKPVMLTEFSFKARDAGLPNTRCAGAPVLNSQQDRADEFEKYAREALGKKYVVGWHWFEYADEPAQGRFDGEDCNLGLVNIEDVPYQPLTGRMKQIHASIFEIMGLSPNR